MNDKDFEKEVEDCMENGEETIFEYPMELPEIWVFQNRKTNKFKFELETLLGFKNTNGAIGLVKSLLVAFTRWMVENDHDVNYRFDYWKVFNNGISLEKEYDTIEEAYAAFRVLALGFIVNARDTATEEDRNKKTIDNIVFNYEPDDEVWVATCEAPFYFEMADEDIVKLAEKVRKAIPAMEELKRAADESNL